MKQYVLQELVHLVGGGLQVADMGAGPGGGGGGPAGGYFSGSDDYSLSESEGEGERFGGWGERARRGWRQERWRPPRPAVPLAAALRRPELAACRR